MTRNPDDIKHGSIQLKSKPSARLNYGFIAGDADSKTLVVFLNGLVMPQASWAETMLQTKLKTQKPGATRPHMLSYDRFGQGLSDKDPIGVHDAMDVVQDLYELLKQFSSSNLSFQVPSKTPGRLILVCNSIGCAIARLFAAEYPETVSGFIFLDSIMANSNFVSIWPDPDSPDFDMSELPEDADSPKLKGPGVSPWMTIVGHDWDTFASENEKSFGVPAALVMKYVNPVWHQYNQGLAKLTDEDKSEGPVIAKGCAHFIQRDNPVFVADVVCAMLMRLH